MTKVKIRKFPHLNKRFVEVDGKTYVLSKFRTKGRGVNKEKDTLTFVEYDQKKYDVLLDSLAAKISERAKVKEIIRQALYDLPIEDINKIEREMKKPVPKTRHEKGCAIIRVGKVPIMLRE